MNGARATIIIVTFNSRQHFARLSRALASQTAPFELVVWDNASRAEERPRADDFPGNAMIVQSEVNLGFAGGNNRAAEHVSTPYLVLLNPDAFPEPAWLSSLLTMADGHANAGAVGSLQVATADERFLDGYGDCYAPMGAYWRGGYAKLREPLALADGEAFSACAAAALFRLQAWRETGGFDESYFCYCEDVDLGFRLRLLGWRVLQTTSAVVAHVGGGASQSSSAFADFHAMRNGVWTFYKNTPGALLWLMALLHALLLIRYLLGAASSGRLSAVSNGVAAGLAGLPRVWATRRMVQRARRASVSEIARVMTWSPGKILASMPDVRPLQP